MAEEAEEHEQEKEQETTEEEKDNSLHHTITEKTGYEPLELLKTPVKPPEIKKARKPTEKQYANFYIGVVVTLMGLVLWPLVDFPLAIAVIVIGIIIVTGSVLVRV